MARRKVSAGKWPHDWSVGVRVWVERQGRRVLEEPTADLLAALDRLKSISGAARSMGISYRHAWLLIQHANTHSREPLVTTAIGGEGGGGTVLTEYGRTALAAFQQIQQQVRREAATAIPRMVATMTSQTQTLHLAAAISLQELVTGVLREYALVQPTVTVQTIFGASNELADQIAGGSPADVLISADRSHIQRLVQAGFLTRGSRRRLAANTLAMVGDASLAGRIRRPADLRRLPGEQIVVADPACPLGVCTSAFLRAAGLWESLRPQLRFVGNSRAVVTVVRGGECRVGIIFGSDVVNAVGMTTLMNIPSSAAQVMYEGAATVASPFPRAAVDLVSFFASKEVHACWRRCGFTVRR